MKPESKLESLTSELHDLRRLQQLFTAILASRTHVSVLNCAASFLRTEFDVDAGVFSLGNSSESNYFTVRFGDESYLKGVPAWPVTKSLAKTDLDQVSWLDLRANGERLGCLCLVSSDPSLKKNEKFLKKFLQLIANGIRSKLSSQDLVRDSVKTATEVEVGQLKVLNRELKKSLESRSLFFSQMSHEIRTPLNAIIGIVDLMKEQIVGDAPFVERVDARQLEVLHRAGNTLLSLVNDILDLAKMEAQELKLDLQPFSLENLLEEILFLFKNRQVKTGVDFVVVPQELNGMACIGDAFRLKQVLMNLVGNAFKFTSEGQITLQARNIGSELFLFQVSDTGIGIPDDKKEQVFGQFKQADHPDFNSSAGTGLGLSICRQIVGLMGGKIWVEDNKKGPGSCFCFQVRLPKASDNDAVKEPVSGSVCVDSLPKHWNILLVDDSADNLFLLNSYLSQLKCKIRFAENGEKAIELYTEFKPDLILMDIQMPVMDGFTAIKAIRRLEKNQNLSPCLAIALTADAFDKEMERYLKAGFNSKLAKPVRRPDLFHEISLLVPENQKDSAS